MKKLTTFLLIPFFMACTNQTPELRLSALFADHMVLQQDSEATVWGTSEPGVIVKIETSWGKTSQIRTDKAGKWMLKIGTPEAGGPYNLTVKARKSTIVINDVLIGEVWLCSGQSNMEMPLKGWPPVDTINNSANEIAQANYPEIRMFTVEKAISIKPETKCKGSWEICNPENAGDFSATAYFFGRELHNKLDVPVGLIHSSWGGTPAESWASAKYLSEIPGYEDIEEKVALSQKKSKEFMEWLNGIGKVDDDSISLEGSFYNLDLDDGQYAASEFNDEDWSTMELPSLWESKEVGTFDGVVWFRKTFEMPDVYPESLSLYLGPIDDMDVAYINGVKVGGIEEGGFWTAERNYAIPMSVIKPGTNTIAVRVIDTRGGGGIYGSKNLAIRKGEKEIVNLSGDWKYLPLAIFFQGELFRFKEDDRSYSKMPKMELSLDANTPTTLYNAMINPLVPYTIKGAIWYQGESNVGRGKQYETLFPAMIKNWRDDWELGDFPFYYVQIAPYNYGEVEPSATAELREAQRLTLNKPNTGMVVTMDIGNPFSIHPGNKQEVGRRLSLLALANDYNMPDIKFSGPMYSTMIVKDGKIVIKFDYAEDGLVCKGDKLTYFEVAGNDGVFYEANAEIADNSVVVSCSKVNEPVQVRFGWRDTAEPNLFNSSGLPASPFITKVVD
ncbi:MAG: beta galactosidase jelly roll domain-containing protein [Bacteroidales bacterium]|nr:beta galactosidase jelly roll domain-containing protein [Bacteroidales bacterium]MBN2819559.1 beta galactosidase jelly roll domain-containing protein [Bacteroidales bacterium]